jgi:cytidine deaminase
MSALSGDLGKFPGLVIPAKNVVELIKKYKTKGERGLMVKIASEFGEPAQTPISKYVVTVVGKEKDTGDLIIGGNLEFKGAPLGFTVHAEQFLFARAFHRGHSIESLALGKPTPCGHCRQFINEFVDGKNIHVFNEAGHEFRIADLLPFSFGPEQLKQKGIQPGKINHGLKLAKKTKDELANAALEAANKSYAPYSKCPSGVALKTKAGIFTGSYIENAAFNPSLSPLHSALINLAASGGKWSDIKEAMMAQAKGSIDQERSLQSLLMAIAPNAKFLSLIAR